MTPTTRPHGQVYSATFLHAVYAELELLLERIDELDRRIERSRNQYRKDQLIESRYQWETYEQQLRALLR